MEGWASERSGLVDLSLVLACEAAALPPSEAKAERTGRRGALESLEGAFLKGQQGPKLAADEKDWPTPFLRP